MAAATDVQLVNISINDVPLQVPKGELIVESVKRLGLEVPIFCYHPRMKPVGMCRMCLIEIGFKQPDGSVRKMPKPQTACTLPASEGLVVYTDTAALHNDRRGVLEFLLINHPLDCPICDRGGECPLQNNTLFYGPSTSRYVELKRHAPKAFPLSQYVTLDLERCIQCGRCVRFTEEISGDAQLALRFRGARTQPGTFELRNFESKFSGNVIEICPVGALTSSKYRFRARPWDLQSRPGICTLCSNGCNVYVDYRVDQVARINGRTNEAVNEEWTCDRGKFGHYNLNSDKRLKDVLVRQGDRLVAGEWADAYGAILDAFRALPAEQIAAIGGGAASNEDLYTFKKLINDGFGSGNLDHRFERDLSVKSYPVQNAIADFESVPSILVFGTSLADELPILFLRVRKSWFKNGTRVVVAHDRPTDVDSFAHLILNYKPGTAAALASALAGEASPEEASVTTGVPADRIAEAKEILAGGAVIASRGIYDLEGGARAAEALSRVGATINIYARQANEEGAALLGVIPTGIGRNTHEILAGAARGDIRALWLFGADPFELHPDRALVQRALENVDFLVVQGHTQTEAFHYASVVLPVSAATEAEGSYTNLERRVQRMNQVVPNRGAAKPSWRVFSELLLRIKPGVPPFNPAEILDRIAAEVPEFAGASYPALAGQGYRLGHGGDPNPQDHTIEPQTQG